MWRTEIPLQDVTPFIPCRMQLATVGSVRLINIYAPSGSNRKEERATFFGQHLFRALDLNSHLPLVLGGDWNCLLNPLDVENAVGFRQKTCAALDDLVKVKKLTDSFRYCYPNKQEFTFFRPGSAPSRLDRIYVSPILKSQIIDVSHVASLADHSGVKLNIDLDLIGVN